MQTQTNTSTQGKWMDMPSSMQTCIQNCLDCFQECSHLIDHCLQKGGIHADPKHIKLLNDCAKICNLSADFMLRHSDYHDVTCKSCAEICIACAESCEAMAEQDEMMKACAQVCRKCAASCEEMSKMQ